VEGLHLEALHSWKPMKRSARVLFVCIENSCRSQMAEAFAHLLAPDVIEAYSAGSRPSGEINPLAVEVMRELGYDLTSHRSKSLSEIPGVKFSHVITMGCGDECPFVPADHHEGWNIPDPKNMPLEGFRRVREMIREHVETLSTHISENHE
jgi:arsenate reductase (thioredoxin)